MVPKTLAEAFVRTLERHSTRVAIHPIAGPPITYERLGARVQRAVAALRSLGLTTGDRVAVLLPNSPEWPVWTYAAALLGLCIVPLNVRFRAPELLHALRASGAKIVLTQHRFLTNGFVERLSEAAGGRLGEGNSASIDALPCLRRIVLLDGPAVAGTLLRDDLDTKAVAEVDLHALAAERAPKDPMWLFWTSGTTSAPKGALLSQSAIANVWRWTELAGYRADDRVLMSRPLFYIAGHFWAMLGPMLHGAASVVGELFTPEEISELCRRHRVTVLSGNPLLLKRVADDPNFDPAAFSSVRLGYFGGSSLPLEEMRRVRERIGYDSLIQTYGMTELGGFLLSTGRDDSIETACRSCGHPFGDIALKLVDAETGSPVADGEVGMLLTNGQPLLDYVGLSAAERATFFDEAGWFRTGDAMRRAPDGSYEFIARAKDLIKVGGENVAAAEIEAVLMSHPRVALAAVVPATDPQRGEIPVAFVELRGGSQAPVEELLAWCRRTMAPFKVPHRIRVIESCDWPLTDTGKIAKHRLVGA